MIRLTREHNDANMLSLGAKILTQEDALKEHFAQAGNVTSAVIIMDKMSGRSKGFGFVEMATDEEAQNAISMFNGQEFDGRKLTVNEARPMEARPPRTGGNGGYGGGNLGGSKANSASGDKDGGLITGPGTGTSDSIPRRLSNGEYVIPADVVKKIGKGNFDKLLNYLHEKQ